MRSRGFTLLEMMVVVAIIAALAAMATTAVIGATRTARVSGQARLLVQRIQTARTRAVGQGNAQGYYIGPNGPGAAGANLHRSFFFRMNVATAPPVYNAANAVQDTFLDTIPNLNGNTLVTVTGPGVALPNPFGIGFDTNGRPTIDPLPPAANFYCIRVADGLDPTIVRWVILFDDGTVKVQRNETYC